MTVIMSHAESCLSIQALYVFRVVEKADMYRNTAS